MVTIRDATADDLPQIVALISQLNEEWVFGEQHRRVFAEIQADARQRLIVVEDGGRIAATASIVVVPNLGRGGRPYAVIENVVVDEAARGGGVGSMMMRHLVDHARDAGCYKVSLTSRTFRTDAHRFYERLGFEPTSVGFRHTLE